MDEKQVNWLKSTATPQQIKTLISEGKLDPVEAIEILRQPEEKETGFSPDVETVTVSIEAYDDHGRLRPISVRCSVKKVAQNFYALTQLANSLELQGGIAGTTVPGIRRDVNGASASTPVVAVEGPPDEAGRIPGMPYEAQIAEFELTHEDGYSMPFRLNMRPKGLQYHNLAIFAETLDDLMAELQPFTFRVVPKINPNNSPPIRLCDIPSDNFRSYLPAGNKVTAHAVTSPVGRKTKDEKYYYLDFQRLEWNK